jgi:hypothetical protein
MQGELTGLDVLFLAALFGSIDLTLSVVLGEKLRFPPSNPKP